MTSFETVHTRHLGARVETIALSSRQSALTSPARPDRIFGTSLPSSACAPATRRCYPPPPPASCYQSFPQASAGLPPEGSSVPLPPTYHCPFMDCSYRGMTSAPEQRRTRRNEYLMRVTSPFPEKRARNDL